MTIESTIDHTSDEMPRWSVADLHPSLDDRSFNDQLELVEATIARLVAQFDPRQHRSVRRQRRQRHQHSH